MEQSFPELGSWSVLDLGGTVQSWLRAPVRPRSLHIVNLTPVPSDVPTWIRQDFADACDPPPGVLDDRYDLVYSNSVIEHVGGHQRRLQFAHVASELSPRYWVQTPYRYFPVEPHWVAPLMQFLPLRARAWYGMWWPLSFSRPKSSTDSVGSQLGVELLDRTQLAFYFPGATIMSERFAGMTKSLIAVRGASDVRTTQDG